jgi:hypothetical protein
MEGKTKKLLHMKPVVDFVSITDTPWESGKNIVGKAFGFVLTCN